MRRPIATTAQAEKHRAPSVLRAAGTGLERGHVDEKIDALNSQYDGGDAEQRKRSYANVVNTFYNLVTDFYEYGWGRSFHFAVRYRGEAFRQSLARHEHYLAFRLGLQPGCRVLDVGAGVGGPMRAISGFAQVHVTGINNNAYQVEKANRYNREDGFGDRCSVAKGDFMDMPWTESEFDAAYEIEALCHAPDLRKGFAEVYRVLKPGALVAGYGWCMTNAYNPSDEEHRRVKLGIERGNGLPELLTTEEHSRALMEAGFTVLDTHDRASTCDADTPWYLPLTAKEPGLTAFRSTSMGRALTHVMVRLLEALRLAPRGSTKVSAMLKATALALVRGGELGIFTPMYFYLARKPEEP